MHTVVLVALLSGCAVAVADERFTRQPCEVPGIAAASSHAVDASCVAARRRPAFATGVP